MADTYEYDVVVIGAGIGGFVSAVTANSLGKRVAIVEKQKVGGNCTNFTCIPSKALIRMGHLSREMAHLDNMGLHTVPPTRIDTRDVMTRVRSVVRKAYEKDLPETFERIGIEVLTGAASFRDAHHIVLNDRTVSSDKFIIAVGTRPLVPPIKGLRELDYLTNENLYELDRLPESLIILGGGVDGLEYASAFGRMGVEVTVVEMATRLLPMVDRELVNRLLHALRGDGIKLLTNTKAEGLYKENGRVILTFQEGNGKYGEIQGDRVLVTIGRRPDLDGLSLEKAGVKSTPRGVVTDSKLRTSVPNIYACGDIAGPYQLASTAEYQGMIAGANAVLPVKKRVDYRNNVYVVFTEPQIGYLGLTEEEARRTYGHGLKVYRFDYGNMRRAMVDGTETGVAKFLCDGRGRLVGAHILGEAAAEVIHEAQVIKAFGKPLHTLHSLTHAYPTYAQALVGRASQLAYLDHMGNSFFVKNILGLIPGYENRLHLARERLAETEPIPSARTSATAGTAIHAGICKEGEVLIIRLPADLTDYDEEPIFTAASRSGPGDAHHILLDFSEVTRMNGLGADMLIKLCARAAMKAWRVAAFGLAGGLRDILRVTELDEAMGLFETREQALSAAGISGCRTPADHGAAPIAPIDTRYWAKPVTSLTVPPMPKEARNMNVNGRRAVGPVNGFGQLWQKIFRLHISDPDITPEQAIGALKQNFPAFQPSFNRFYASATGIAPGEIVILDSITPGGPVSTGVMVLYADDRTFTFNCPQGHPESGFVTFSASEENGRTVVQILGLARANDPLFEGAFRLVGSKIQARIWTHVLASLAAYLGVPARIATDAICVDTGLRWSQAANLWYNAQIRTLLGEPLHLLKMLFRARDRKGDRPA